MTTQAILEQAVLNLLYGQELVERPLEDRINGALANGTTEAVVFDTPAMWDTDDLVEYKVDGEVTRLISDTVQKRAQLGTTGASKLDNAEVVKNPPFPLVDVRRALKEVVLVDLWPNVWTWVTDTLAASSSDRQYDLDEFVEEVVLVYQENIGSDERFRPLPPHWWDVERVVEATVATNSNLLILHHVYDFDETVYFTAKRRPDFSSAGFTAMSDEIAAMIPWAAAAKLLLSKSGQIKNAAARTQKDDGAIERSYARFMGEFVRMRDAYSRQLMGEVREDRRWRGPSRVFGSTW